MTSQKDRHQTTQDDSYTNQDDKAHKGPIKEKDPQPGPKMEKQKGTDLRPEIRPDGSPVGNPGDEPEKQVPSPQPIDDPS